MNTPFDSLRGRNRRNIFIATGLIGCVLGAIPAAHAGNDTWVGLGPDRNWTTGANWLGGVPPNPGDSLFFGGTVHTGTTNNFSNTSFNNITFNTPAGFFTLGGNQVPLTGNITNNQVVTLQTISLPLSLSTTPTVSVVPNGVLTLNGTISGIGGLSLLGGGTVVLNGANPFTGGVTVNSSSIAVVGADANLGAGNLVLNNGTLSLTNSFALGAARGIAAGPGWGGINVPSGITNTYGGVITDNGGPGGLTKSGYGTLSLFGANTYSGITSNTIGTLLLDFTQPSSPASGIINSTSSLELGGGNAGGGVENVAQLIMDGGAAADVQSFASTFSTFGGSAIIATNKTGGTVNLALGVLSHSPGGTITFVTPQASGGGHVTTTSANINGILGGYALIGGDNNAPVIFSDSGHNLITGTNFASVDGSGNIVNYTGYSNVTSSSTVASQIAGSSQPNISINDTAAASVVSIDNDLNDSTTDINAIKWTTFSGGADVISIGQGNTLRLGQFGGIIRNGPTTSSSTFVGGPNSQGQGTGTGTSGYANIGTLTAGGPNINAPGEIVITANNPSETSGTIILECGIADNGTGPVTVVKMGPGSIKLDGSNSFSGGLYLLQGRVQIVGGEIGNPNWANGGGSGSIYVLPGAYLFPSGASGGQAVPNPLFVAGAGDAHEPLGALRNGEYTGTITLIGDAEIGAAAILDGPVVGPYGLTLGSGATVNGGATLNSSANNWTGTTTMTARSNTGANTINCGAINVIPNGFGYGNVNMVGFSSGTVTFDLTGFNQTINGLSSSGTGTSVFIQNGAAGTATLTIGNNDQSGTFGGIVQDAAGQMSLTKIGGGVETFTGVSTYSGPTIINGGSLAFSGGGSIGSSASVTVNSGATLDITGDNGSFSTANPVQLLGGTMAGNGSVGALTLNTGALTLDLNPATINVTANSLTLAGSTNLVNVDSVVNVSGYPTAFTVVKYSGALSGSLNFGLGSVPNASTGGFFSNDVANSRIVLVLTNGPAPLTWVGGDPTNPTFWDFVTANWLKFKGTGQQVPSPFESQDPVIFDDTGETNNVSLNTNMQPGFITGSNNVLNYTFTGSGSLGGIATLEMFGTGTLTFLNTGGDSYSRGVVVNSGTVVFGANNAITGGVGISNSASMQIGVNTGTGTLPGGNVDDEGSLIFNVGASNTVPNNISGAGTITKEDNSTLTLSGNNGTLTGPINVTSGILRPGSGNAFGTGVTTINSGTTLDVNGQQLNTTAQVTVSGTGVGGLGAIINNGAGNQNALGSVTLAGNTTFGGTNRWDIRGSNGLAQLSTSGNAYSLTKTGPNLIGLVNITVDAALGNIDIQQGTLDYEAGTSGLGNPGSALTVETGATLELFNSANALNKNIVLNGSGTNDTLLCGNNLFNNISGQVTLNGPCIFDAASGTALSFNNTVSGSGSVTKIGSGTNTIGGGATASYSGGTTISNGTLVVDGTLSGSPVFVAGTLAGSGSVSVNVTNWTNGIISPGDIAGSPQATLTVGNLTLNTNSTVVLELSANTNSGNDLLAAANLTVNGTNTLKIVPLSFMNVGDVYTLITYTGPTLPVGSSNQFTVVPPNSFFSFALLDPSTTPGLIQIKVIRAVGNDFWKGNLSTSWDTTTTNWTRNSNPVNFNDGDFVTFDDTTSVTNVNIVGTRTNSGISEFSSAQAYIFTSTANSSLAGSGGLDFEGTSLTIANIGTNTFTGLINIAGGMLQVGNGGTNGTLGTGVITNNGALVFDRSDANLTIPNSMFGAGSVTNIGTGRVTLSGSSSSYSGPVTILNGTVRTLASNALGGAISSGIIISNGATLDITNNVNLGRQSITATGAGVGGNGAIINSSGTNTFVGPNFSQLTITTNIVIGGSGRLDFRASSATAQDANLNAGGMPYTFTKVGSNLLQTAGVQIDGALGDIIVNGGSLGFQWQMPSLGNPTNNLAVSNGASIAFFDMSNAVTKNLILSNNASVLAQQGPAEFDGPVTVGGTGIFNATGGAAMLFANELSGPGSLVKTGTNTVTLSLVQTNGGAEIYSGNTYVNQGTLALIDNANVTNSPIISLSNNAILSVVGRVDGTLSLGAAMPQTLTGGGVVNGTLVENAGSTINPGNIKSTAVLIVSNATTLNGSVVMDLNIGAAAITNDEIAAPSFSISGPLTVTNVGPDLQTGDHFQLFNLAVSGFSSVTLPANNGTPNKIYQWRNDLAANGSITLTNVIVIAPTTNAAITRTFLSGTNLVIQGTNNNVPNTNFHYVVYTATNITTKLANWSPLATNSFNPDGTFDYTNPVIPGKPVQFLNTKVVP